MKSWRGWDRNNGRPRHASGLVDVRYADGKEFTGRRAEDCYWGKDSLIESWRPTPINQLK